MGKAPVVALPEGKLIMTLVAVAPPSLTVVGGALVSGTGGTLVGGTLV